MGGQPMTTWKPLPRDYPPGYAPGSSAPDVFDPALRHHVAAFVKGAPNTLPETDQAQLRRETTRAIDICVRALADSPLRDHLVARGSVTLAHWYGRHARPAKDLDFVVRPSIWKPNEREASKLLSDVREIAESTLGRHFNVVAAD